MGTRLLNVRRGLIWVAEGPRPSNADDAFVRDELALIGRLAANLGDRLPTRLLGVVCDACGCLCLPGEACPSYRCWAERDAVRASWSLPHTDVWPVSDLNEGTS